MKYFGIRKPFERVIVTRLNTHDVVVAFGQRAHATISCQHHDTAELVMLFATARPIAEREDWHVVNYVDYGGDWVICEDGKVIRYDQIGDADE